MSSPQASHYSDFATPGQMLINTLN